MSHPNSADRVHAALFTGVPVQGNLQDSYLSLVIQLLASRDAAETLSGVAELDRQLTALHGDSLAVQHFRQATNSLREKQAR